MKKREKSNTHEKRQSSLLNTVLLSPLSREGVCSQNKAINDSRFTSLGKAHRQVESFSYTTKLKYVSRMEEEHDTCRQH